MKVTHNSIQVVVRGTVLPEFKNGNGPIDYCVKFDMVGEDAYLVSSTKVNSVCELTEAIKVIAEEYELSYYENELEAA